MQESIRRLVANESEWSLSVSRSDSRSPSIAADLGYYTLVPSHSLAMHSFANKTNREVSSLSSHSSTTSTIKRNQINYFDELIDEVVIKIFSYLTTYDLCHSCARVCRRWYYLTWNPILWKSLTFKPNICHNIDIDKAITTIVRLLSRESYCRQNTRKYESNDFDFSYNTYSSTDTSITNSLNNEIVCLPIQTIALNGFSNLSDKSLLIIARKCCLNLKIVEIRCCTQTFFGINKILAKCANLEKLDVAGCSNAAFNAIQPPQHSPGLRYLDLSDCKQLDDFSLNNIIKYYGSKLTHLYLRRCTSLTDQSIKTIASHCQSLQELSISYCPQFTDSICYDLSLELSTSLRYLSMARCQLTDAGLQQIATHCSKLRYLNIRDCEAVSDAGLIVLARSCATRLKSLDLTKCDITDRGLKVLSEKCPNLRKLSVKECLMVSDIGIKTIAYNCRQLIHLNIANCDNITVDAYRYVKTLCRRCLINHTNPGFS